jgi:hypothetical protein
VGDIKPVRLGKLGDWSARPKAVIPHAPMAFGRKTANNIGMRRCAAGQLIFSKEQARFQSLSVNWYHTPPAEAGTPNGGSRRRRAGNRSFKALTFERNSIYLC